MPAAKNIILCPQHLQTPLPWIPLQQFKIKNMNFVCLLEARSMPLLFRCFPCPLSSGGVSLDECQEGFCDFKEAEQFKLALNLCFDSRK